MVKLIWIWYFARGRYVSSIFFLLYTYRLTTAEDLVRENKMGYGRGNWETRLRNLVSPCQLVVSRLLGIDCDAARQSCEFLALGSEEVMPVKLWDAVKNWSGKGEDLERKRIKSKESARKPFKMELFPSESSAFVVGINVPWFFPSNYTQFLFIKTKKKHISPWTFSSSKQLALWKLNSCNPVSFDFISLW